MMKHKKRKPIKGRQFGSLIAVERLSIGRWTGSAESQRKYLAYRWLCKCTCGAVTIKWQTNMLGGKSVQCGECSYKQNRRTRQTNKHNDVYESITPIPRLR